MTNQFKAGDKVEFVTRYKEHTGQPIEIGTPAEFDGIYKHDPSLVQVRLTGGTRRGEVIAVFEKRIKLVEEPAFTFQDIQKGDTIRRSRTYKSGATEVREGTVSRIGKGYATEEGESFILAYDTDTSSKQVTLELLNRPEPEPVKEEWETAEAGDRLVVRNSQNVTRVLTKQANGFWSSLVIREDGLSWAGFERDDMTLKGQLENSGFSVGKPQFIKA